MEERYQKPRSQLVREERGRRMMRENTSDTRGWNHNSGQLVCFQNQRRHVCVQGIHGRCNRWPCVHLTLENVTISFTTALSRPPWHVTRKCLSSDWREIHPILKQFEVKHIGRNLLILEQESREAVKDFPKWILQHTQTIRSMIILGYSNQKEKKIPGWHESKSEFYITTELFLFINRLLEMT